MKSIKLIFAMGLMLLGGMMNSVSAQEIYAVRNDSKMVLYYDDQIDNRSGVIIDWTPGNGTSDMSTSQRDAFTTVELDASMQAARPTSTAYWFYDLGNVTSFLHLDYLNTSQVNNMERMFHSCNALTSLDLHNFNTGNVGAMNEMFEACSSLTTLDVSSFNTANVLSMEYMFSSCSSLTTIYCDKTWSPTYSDNMFSGCTSLVGGKGTAYNSSIVDKTYARPDGGSSQPGYFTGPAEPEIYAVADGTKMVLYYDDQKASRENVITNWTPETGTSNMTEEEIAAITSVELDASMQAARPTNMKWWFALNNVTNIIHLDYLNTSEVTNMYSVFYKCGSLTSLDLSHFNTSKVKNMNQLFLHCYSLTELNLSSFNTSNVTEMWNMFNNCHSLTTLDLSHFNTAKVTNMSQMFAGCSALTTIYCNDEWNPSSSENMFTGCTSLVGGKGTAYDAAHKDAAYARPDKTGQAGYFTQSPEKAVEELINAIGEVEYTAESKAKIDEARAGYDALTKAQKEKVSNYDVLKQPRRCTWH